MCAYNLLLAMSLSKEITKYIYPVLKRFGFQKHHHLWRLAGTDWHFAVEVKSGHQGNEQEFLELDLGAYSLQVEELLGERLPFGADLEFMPNGIIMCHFFSRIQFLTDDLEWDTSAGNMFFPRGADVSADFETLATRLSDLLPRFMDKFGRLETIVEYQQRGEGFAANSSHGNLRSAAACILLGRYDDAEAMIKKAVKAGSPPLIKQWANHLTEEMTRRKQQECND